MLNKKKVIAILVGTLLFVAYGLFSANKTKPRRLAAYAFAEDYIRNSKDVARLVGNIDKLEFDDADSDQLGPDQAYRIVYRLSSTKGSYIANISVIETKPSWRVHQLGLKAADGVYTSIVNMEEK